MRHLWANMEVSSNCNPVSGERFQGTRARLPRSFSDLEMVFSVRPFLRRFAEGRQNGRGLSRDHLSPRLFPAKARSNDWNSRQLKFRFIDESATFLQFETPTNSNSWKKSLINQRSPKCSMDLLHLSLQRNLNTSKLRFEQVAITYSPLGSSARPKICGKLPDITEALQ